MSKTPYIGGTLVTDNTEIEKGLNRNDYRKHRVLGNWFSKKRVEYNQVVGNVGALDAC